MWVKSVRARTQNPAIEHGEGSITDAAQTGKVANSGSHL